MSAHPGEKPGETPAPGMGRRPSPPARGGGKGLSSQPQSGCLFRRPDHADPPSVPSSLNLLPRLLLTLPPEASTFKPIAHLRKLRSERLITLAKVTQNIFDRRELESW